MSRKRGFGDVDALVYACGLHFAPFACSSLTTSEWPMVVAKSSAVFPLVIPCFNVGVSFQQQLRHLEDNPQLAARSSAVLPDLSLASMLAPSSSRSFSTALLAARSSGVFPSLSLTSILGPFLQ